MTEFLRPRTRLKQRIEDACDAVHASSWLRSTSIAARRHDSALATVRGAVDTFHSIECEDCAYTHAAPAKLSIRLSWQAKMAQAARRAGDRCSAASDPSVPSFNAG
jgi:hypothetical protein